jgi:SAM domain (Sterile alpha motif)
VGEVRNRLAPMGATSKVMAGSGLVASKSPIWVVPRSATTALRGRGGYRCLAEGAWVGALRNAFRDNAIGFDVLPQLTDEHLKDLGLPLGDRLRLLKAAAILAGPAEPRSAAEEKPSPSPHPLRSLSKPSGGS